MKFVPVPLLAAAAILITSARAAAPVSTRTVTPGVGLTGIRLGMKRDAVIALLGRPTQTARLSLGTKTRLPAAQQGSYAEDIWRSGGEVLVVVLSRSQKVLQIGVAGPPFKTTTGLSTGSVFPAVRAKHPGITVRSYQMEDAVTFFADDVKRGIAFTTSTQDDQATYESLSTLKPELMLVHPAGQPVLPVTDAAVGTPDTTPPGSSYTPRIQAWFANRAR
ncbi:MAG: hypothetical protein H7Z41_00150 [Cytophagales bacterium]|nr:hypothetical protein [Armatimonadota bacterium]